MAGNHHHSQLTTRCGLNQPDMGEAPAKQRQPGLIGERPVCGGSPHAMILLQCRSPRVS
jgi:hypothetical protein